MTVFLTGDSMLSPCCQDWSGTLRWLCGLPCRLYSREHPFCDSNRVLAASGVETGVSGGSMNRGIRAPESPKRGDAKIRQENNRPTYWKKLTIKCINVGNFWQFAVKVCDKTEWNDTLAQCTHDFSEVIWEHKHQNSWRLGLCIGGGAYIAPRPPSW